MAQNKPARLLPIELFKPIIAHVPQADTRTLCALARASKAFRAEAQPILFSNPDIPRYAVYPQDFNKHIRFLRSVIESPNRLALFVARYQQPKTVPMHPMLASLGIPDSGPAFKKICTLIRVALPLMVNLKYLECDSPDGGPSAHILRGCAFQLEELSWKCGRSDDLVMFRDILPTQTSLSRLSLTEVDVKVLKRDPGVWGSIKSMLPQLVSLTGPRGLFEAILPGRLGRPVEHIFWTCDPTDVRDGSVAHMSRQLRMVKDMNLDGFYFPQTPMKLLVKHLRGVERLGLMDCGDQNFPLFERLPNLRHLIIDFSTQTNRPAQYCLLFAQRAFHFCGNLRIIDVRHDKEHFMRYDCTVSPLGTNALKLRVEEAGSPYSR